VISFSPLHRDPRVKRQISILRNHVTITAAGFSSPVLPGVSWWPVDGKPRSLIHRITGLLLLMMRAYPSYYRRTPQASSLLREWRKVGSPRFDIVVANDIDTLPVALDIAGKAPVFFDAHEYYPGESSGLLWRLAVAPYRDWQCRTYLKRAAGMSTVGQLIAAEFSKRFSVLPIAVYNAPCFHDLHPQPVDRQCIRLVHHGISSPQRRIENLIHMMGHLDGRFTLDLFLVAGNHVARDYLTVLKRLAVPFGSRIRFNSPVAVEQIAPTLNRFDIGLAYVYPSHANYSLCLPNKFFEYVQARLALVTGPSPEMASLVQRHHLGEVSDDFSPQAIARALLQLSSKELFQYKVNAHRAAAVLHFMPSSQLFLDTIARLLPHHR
jgi:hypothetical protein